jgi:hypothetical protein
LSVNIALVSCGQTKRILRSLNGSSAQYFLQDPISLFSASTTCHFFKDNYHNCSKTCIWTKSLQPLFLIQISAMLFFPLGLCNVYKFSYIFRTNWLQKYDSSDIFQHDDRGVLNKNSDETFAVNVVFVRRWWRFFHFDYESAMGKLLSTNVYFFGQENY